MMIATCLILLGESTRMDSKGILDYIPLLGLGANLAMIFAAYFMLKFSVGNLQTSVMEMKGELADLGNEMKNGFEKVGEKLGAIGDRVTRLETVRDMLGRNPHH